MARLKEKPHPMYAEWGDLVTDYISKKKISAEDVAVMTQWIIGYGRHMYGVGRDCAGKDVYFLAGLGVTDPEILKAGAEGDVESALSQQISHAS